MSSSLNESGAGCEASLETVLERLAREWRGTFDAIDTPILLLDPAGRVMRLNRSAQRLAGLRFDEIMGRPVDELAPGEPWREMSVLARTATRIQCGLSGHVRDQGGRHWDVAASLLPEQPPDRAAVILTARDVTAVVRLEASLHRAEAMSAMGALVGGVAHQARNPLFSISATVDALEARFGTSEQLTPFVSTLRIGLARLSNLMRELLEYGKPPRSEVAQGDLRQALDAAVRSVEPLARDRGASVVCREGSPLPPLRLDWGRTAQAIQNVLENALHHSPRGGTVTVETRAVDRGEGRRWVELSVADAGPGFAPGDLPSVFQPFFSRRRGGTGLGLSIAQRIVEAHGGTIVAANRLEGGAVVSLALPSAEERAGSPDSGNGV